MKKLLLIISITTLLFSCGSKDDTPQPAQQITPTTPTGHVLPADSAVMFTLYSKRVPYIWKRVVNTVWVQDTIKTNHATRYEPFDTRNMGIGYFVTMNLSGIKTDSMSIRIDYNNKSYLNTSVKGLSFAFVKLDNVK